MLLDGKKVSIELQLKLAKKIKEHGGRKPGLTFVIIGDNAASHTYVRMKKKACERVGIHSTVLEFPSTYSQNELFALIEQLNQDETVDGILIQLPLPSQFDPNQVMMTIDPNKDVDGFSPINVGKMLLGIDECFLPCTPKGIHTLLTHYKIPTDGKHLVIVGRSNIVGKPLSAMMVQKKPGCNATVTIAHSGTQDLASITRTADILVAAIGKPKAITKEMVKPGAVVIDVGINRLEDKTLCGDVDFDQVEPIASYITPVPGGIGPMTIASLLENTTNSYLSKPL